MQPKPIKTRQRIQEKTIELLNARGLSNVTMRDVSGALNISPGNLTYHYPKWESLMDDIFTGFQKGMSEVYDHFPTDISEVASYIERIFNLQAEYAFIFSDFYIFFLQNPIYDNIKVEFFQERMTIMREALQRLVVKKYLYPASDEHNYDLLVKNTWLLLSGWHGFSKVLKDTSYAFKKEDFFLSIWNLYAHHLTPRGQVLVRQSYRKTEI